MRAWQKILFRASWAGVRRYGAHPERLELSLAFRAVVESVMGPMGAGIIDKSLKSDAFLKVLKVNRRPEEKVGLYAY